MFQWISKVSGGKVLLCGLLYTVIAFGIHMVESMLTMNYYQMPQYLGVWSKLMMPTNGAPPPEFFITDLILTFVIGISLAVIYCYIRDLLPKKFWLRVTHFADLMIATSFIFFTLPSYLMFNLPWQLLVSWFVSAFIIQVMGSYVIVKVLK